MYVGDGALVVGLEQFTGERNDTIIVDVYTPGLLCRKRKTSDFRRCGHVTFLLNCYQGPCPVRAQAQTAVEDPVPWSRRRPHFGAHWGSFGSCGADCRPSRQYTWSWSTVFHTRPPTRREVPPVEVESPPLTRLLGEPLYSLEPLSSVTPFLLSHPGTPVVSSPCLFADSQRRSPNPSLRPSDHSGRVCDGGFDTVSGARPRGRQT